MKRFGEIAGLVVLFVCLCANAEIPIMGYWLPEWEHTEVNYRRAKAAGVTLVNYGPADLAAVRAHLDVAARAGIRLALEIPKPEKVDTAAFVRAVKDHPALDSYFLCDEPNVSAMPALGALARVVIKEDPLHTPWVNWFGTILPVDNPTNWYGTVDYKTYIDRSLAIIPTRRMSFDQYPVMAFVKTVPSIPFRNVKGLQLMSNWYEALEIVSAVSRERGIPFWGFALATAFGGGVVRPVPEIGHLRLQQYSNLAYGAQGLEYWAYWIPIPPVDNIHTGMVGEGGRHSPVTDRIRRVNAEIQARAFVFEGATCVGVWHTGASIPQCTRRLDRLPAGVEKLETPDGGAVVSVLEKGGRRFLVVVNRSPDAELTLNLRLAPGARRVLEDGRTQDVADHEPVYWMEPGYAEIFELSATR